MNAYLTEKMTRYVLADRTNEASWKMANAVVNSKVARTLGVKSVGGMQRCGVENYTVKGLPNDFPAGKLKELIFDEDGNKTKEYEMYRIRKLTPRECWRLMDLCERNEDGTWNDEVFERAEKVNSNTQLYKQAGNGIVCCVVGKIVQTMLEGE